LALSSKLCPPDPLTSTDQPMPCRNGAPRAAALPARRRGLLSRLTLVGALVLGALVGVPAGVAVAASKPAQQPTVLWSVTPASANPAQSQDRSTFAYELAKGASLTDKVAVYNYSSVALPLSLYATDGLDTAEGQFGIIPTDQQPVGVGTWVKPVEGSIIVMPHTVQVVPFTVHVPATATPGDHAGAVVASLKTPATDSKGRRVLVQQQDAVEMFVRVAGPLVPKLTVKVKATNLRRAFALGLGSLDVTYTVRNVGNVRLGATQSIDVDAPFGITLKTVHLRSKVPELLPGASIVLHAHVDGVLPTVLVTAQVNLHPYSPVKTVPPPPSSSGSDTVWMIPWLWLLIAAAVIGWIVWRRRRRAALGPRPGAPPGATPPTEAPLGPDAPSSPEPEAAR
jgi:hypothetical protein